MKKHEIHDLFVMVAVIMSILVIGVCIRDWWVSKDTQTTTHKSAEITVEREVPTEDVLLAPDEICVEESAHSVDEDSYLLAKIAMAEAEGEDIEGKAHVIMVILNRVMDDRFPDTVGDVIYQPNQFTPVHNGRWEHSEPNEECWEALEMVMVDDWDESQGALYFESYANADNWHSRNLEFLFSHGNHRFYK